MEKVVLKNYEMEHRLSSTPWAFSGIFSPSRINSTEQRQWFFQHVFPLQTEILQTELYIENLAEEIKLLFIYNFELDYPTYIETSSISVALLWNSNSNARKEIWKYS